MSQAETLLNNLNEDDISSYTTASNGEEHIIVKNDRFIVVPDSLKRIAVQHDHNVETVTFDCPRYWDEHDMSQMTPYINYRRPDGECGAYAATNVIVDENDPNIMHFDWTIAYHVTHIKGPLVFNVCIKKTDEYGYEINHWNSELCKDMNISEGLECDPAIIDLPFDITNQIFERLSYLESRVDELSKG